MLNILLVEDEPIILRKISNTIKSFQENYNIVATALNGQNAMEIIDSKGSFIDIVITDIHIPMYDGLELIEYINMQYPHILCMILTGYSEFSYAKKAIQLNVFAYLLKPINEKEINEQLKKAYEKKCVDGMLTGIGNNVNSYPTDKSISSQYCIATICIGNFPFLPLSFDTIWDNPWTKAAIADLFKKHTNYIRDYWIIAGKSPFEMYILFSLNDSTSLSKETAIEDLFHPMLTGSVPVTLLISTDALDMHAIGKLIQRLRFQLSRKLILGTSQLLYYQKENIDYKLPTNEHITNAILHLTNLFRQMNVSLFTAELKHFLSLMMKQNLTQFAVTEYLTALFTGCMNNQSGNFQENSVLETVNDAIIYSTSYETLYQNIISIFNDFFYELTNERTTANDKAELLLHIDTYIKQHFMESINTKQMSDTFGFTPAYLSKIYRDFKSTTPIDYIIQLRMEKAKELFLSNPKLLIKDVALSVGYDDPLYFSKVFKKEIGQSPKQFIQQLRYGSAKEI